tara:strand:+ start:295 stop:2313 length:2019 start_codon:yes stop_codon:yes gene_type:complete
MQKIIKLFIFVGIFSVLPIKSYSNIVEELTKLNNLYKEGAITKEEFKKAKSIILKSEKDNKITEKKKVKPKKKVKNAKDINTNLNEDLTKTYVSLKDADELGTFISINYSPKGMFDENKFNSFPSKAKRSLSDMYLVFVQQKYLMEKYPENVMKAMGYFEYFYLDQLRDKNQSIEAFKNNYPNVPVYAKKDVKSLYTLNQARKKMRESMGLSLDSDIKEALDRYMVMHDVLSLAEKKTIKLNSLEKQSRKHHNKLKTSISSLRKNLKLRLENRLKDKEFIRLTKKNIKQINTNLKFLSKEKYEVDNFYKIISNFVEKPVNIFENCKPNCSKRNLMLFDDSLNVLDTFIKDAEKKLIKKKYVLDMQNVNLENLETYKSEILKDVSLSMKNSKIEKRNLVQKSILNLSNNNLGIDEYLNKLIENDFNISSIDMTFDKLDDMKLWAMNDWANSWKGSLPQEIKDSDGNIIEFTDENLDDIKAQLAYSTFNQIIDLSDLNFKENIGDSIKEIAQTIKNDNSFDLQSFLSQDFSITLNNYSKLVGNSIGIDINDFNDLTNWANQIEGTSISASDYANAWQNAQYYDSASTWGEITKGVDLLDTVGSFEAASIAKDLGADLQQVADTIAQAATVGISTDLEAAAQGLGYNSFADAVAAYNEKYGTNYTVESAKEALGQ